MNCDKKRFRSNKYTISAILCHHCLPLWRIQIQIHPVYDIRHNPEHTALVSIYIQQRNGFAVEKYTSTKIYSSVMMETNFNSLSWRAWVLLCGLIACAFNENRKTIRQIYKINIRIMHNQNIRCFLSVFLQSSQYCSPYRQYQNYQQDQARAKSFERTDDYSSSSSTTAAAPPDRSSWPKASTSLLVDVQSLQQQQQQQSTSRPSSQEQIPMQPLSTSQPDSPSLVKVKSWYTISKQDVC